MEKVEDLSKSVEYIQLTKDIIKQDLAGRQTIIGRCCCGFILTEENITLIGSLSEPHKNELLDRLRFAKKCGRELAFVRGYPVILERDEFIKKLPTENSGIVWELII